MRYQGLLLAVLLVAPSAIAADGEVPLPRPRSNAAARRVQTDVAGQTWTTGAYVYDGAGNIVQIGTDTAPGSDAERATFVYDGYARLTSSTVHRGTAVADLQQFTYDPFGNLTSIVSNSAPARRVPGVDSSTNRLRDSGSCNPDEVCYFAAYDEAGNQTYAAGVNYRWDALGALRRRDDGAVNRAYVYNADNERIAVAAVSAGQTQWTYTPRGADQKVLRELRRTLAAGVETWGWREDWVYAGSRLLAAVTYAPEGPQTRHFHPDHLGSPRLVTSQSAAKLALMHFRPFGEEAARSESLDERMKFTGHERDDAGPFDARDLDYMHARYYDMNVGRFLSVDPIGGKPDSPQSWNRFAYALNSPVVLTDPAGECAQAPCPEELVLRERDAARAADQRNLFIVKVAAGGEAKAVIGGKGVRATAKVEADLTTGNVTLDVGAGLNRKEKYAVKVPLYSPEGGFMPGTEVSGSVSSKGMKVTGKSDGTLTGSVDGAKVNGSVTSSGSGELGFDFKAGQVGVSASLKSITATIPIAPGVSMTLGVSLTSIANMIRRDGFITFPIGAR